MKGRLVGVDFGTTNSLCAFMDGDRPVIIPNARGARSTPSVVALSPRGEFLVGESARNQAHANPARTVLAVKRLLGGEARIAMGERSQRPEEVAAKILASLRADAERHLGCAVESAVVTAPAHFSEPARRALLEAGRLAGLEIVRILNEPTAAALARAWGAAGREKEGEEGSRLLLVYDFGGGTFDVTILRQEGADCKVLASRGEDRLGGIDIDRELYALARGVFLERHGVDVESDPTLAQQLADQAERAKIDLSELETASIALPFATRASDGGLVHPEVVLARAEFEAIAGPFVERTMDLIARTLADAGVAASSIDHLVLSGGSSRMPMVRRLIAERFGLKPAGGVDPEEIVAQGAAVQAALLSGSRRLRVRDVVSRTYGVEIDGGRFVPLIRKNSPVPADRQRMFTTISDNQDSVEIHVLQGESSSATDNLSLGRFLLAGLRPAKAGLPRISVDFAIDESDILHVSARDLETGSVQAITIVDLDRGASDESAASLAAKAADLAGRLEGLLAAARVEASLAAEIGEAVARGRAASPAEGEGRLRALRAELEGLVAELLSRGAAPVLPVEEPRAAPEREHRHPFRAGRAGRARDEGRGR